MTPLNECDACGHDFASLELFDRHRVGKHAYTYSEGVKMDPPREDGRRCLSVDEMVQKGWHRNERGRWADPARARQVRERFAAAA